MAPVTQFKTAQEDLTRAIDKGKEAANEHAKFYADYREKLNTTTAAVKQLTEAEKEQAEAHKAQAEANSKRLNQELLANADLDDSDAGFLPPGASKGEAMEGSRAWLEKNGLTSDEYNRQRNAGLGKGGGGAGAVADLLGGGAGGKGGAAGAIAEVGTTAATAAEGGVTALLTKLGGLGVAAGGAVVALRHLIDANPQVKSAFDNMKDAAGTFVTDALDQVLGKGDLLKGLFDTVTTLLGGQTDAWKKALGPIQDYVGMAEPVQTAAEKMSAALKQQAEAAAEAVEERRANGEVEGVFRNAEARDFARDIARRKDEIIGDEDMSAEDKDAMLSALDDERASGLEEIESRGRAEELDREGDEFDTSINSLRGAIEERDKAQEKADKARRAALAQAKLDTAKATDSWFDHRGRWGGRMSDEDYEFASSNKEDLLGISTAYSGPNISPSEAKKRVEEAQAELDAATKADAADREALEEAKRVVKERASEAVDKRQNLERSIIKAGVTEQQSEAEQIEQKRLRDRDRDERDRSFNNRSEAPEDSEAQAMMRDANSRMQQSANTTAQMATEMANSVADGHQATARGFRNAGRQIRSASASVAALSARTRVTEDRHWQTGQDSWNDQVGAI